MNYLTAFKNRVHLRQKGITENSWKLLFLPEIFYRLQAQKLDFQVCSVNTQYSSESGQGWFWLVLTKYEEEKTLH